MGQKAAALCRFPSIVALANQTLGYVVPPLWLTRALLLKIAALQLKYLAPLFSYLRLSRGDFLKSGRVDFEKCVRCNLAHEKIGIT